MRIRDAVLSILSTQQEGTLIGRTLFQKKLYFLGELAEEDFGFAPYFYGPFSSKAADQIGALCAAGFVEEKVEPTGSITGAFGETVRYVYSLTQAGQEIIGHRSEDFGRFRDTCERINSHSLADNTILLPIAAKIHFIVNEEGRASEAEIRKRAASLGWDLNRIGENEIAQVVAYLEHLDLIPFHLDRAIKGAGRRWTLSSIQSHAASERTRSGSDSNSLR